MRLRMPRLEARIAGTQPARRAQAGGPFCLAHRSHMRHHLRAAGDDEFLHAGHDLSGSEAGGGDAAAAEAVQGHAAGSDVEAGVQGSHASQVATLLALLSTRAPDDVVDIGGLQVVAFAKGFEDRGRQMLRVRVRQRPFPHLADTARRANGVYDVCLGHSSLLLLSGHRDMGPNSKATPLLTTLEGLTASTRDKSHDSAGMTAGG